jgi:transcriptional regulator with XRE-family HTH domain
MDTSPQKNQIVDVAKIQMMCKDRGLPLAEFGRRIGIDSRETISTRLRNKTPITGDELVLMARELGVTVEELTIATPNA